VNGWAAHSVFKASTPPIIAAAAAAGDAPSCSLPASQLVGAALTDVMVAANTPWPAAAAVAAAAAGDAPSQLAS
jgi:hypothetical protein